MLIASVPQDGNVHAPVLLVHPSRSLAIVARIERSVVRAV
jgi:hypothetical protein